MKCISCDIEINPKWKHAVEINVCPFCGEHILEEHLKNLLTSLGETMSKLQEYPEQVSDWLLSNHNYIKTDSPLLPTFLPKEMIRQLKSDEDERDFQERKKFTVKVKTELGEEEIQAETLQSEDKTNDFFKRAEVIKGSPKTTNTKPNPKAPKEFRNPAEKTEYLKNLKSQIEQEGSQGIISEDGLASMISPNSINDADPELVSGFSSLITTGDIISSAIPTDSLDDEDSMTDRILSANIAAAGGGYAKGKGGGANPADIKAARDMYAKVSESRKRMESGEAREGGGFSRR